MYALRRYTKFSSLIYFKTMQTERFCKEHPQLYSVTLVYNSVAWKANGNVPDLAGICTPESEVCTGDRGQDSPNVKISGKDSNLQPLTLQPDVRTIINLTSQQ